MLEDSRHIRSSRTQSQGIPRHVARSSLARSVDCPIHTEQMHLPLKRCTSDTAVSCAYGASVRCAERSTDGSLRPALKTRRHERIKR